MRLEVVPVEVKRKTILTCDITESDVFENLNQAGTGAIWLFKNTYKALIQNLISIFARQKGKFDMPLHWQTICQNNPEPKCKCKIKSEEPLQRISTKNRAMTFPYLKPEGISSAIPRKTWRHKSGLKLYALIVSSYVQDM